MATPNSSRDDLAKEYDALHNRLFLLQILVVALSLSVYQFSGASAALAAGLAARFGEAWWWTNAAYTAVSVFGFISIMTPFAYYGGHVLETHFELSDETFGEWFADYVRSLLADVALATALFSVIYALLRWLPRGWWLAAAAFYILFGLLLPLLISALVLPRARRLEPVAEGTLAVAARGLLARAGVEVEGIYKVAAAERGGAAATLSGWGRRRHLVLGEALLSDYNEEEILALLAREVGRHVNRHTPKLALSTAALAVLGFFLARPCLEGLVAFFGFSGASDIAAAPLLVFCLFVFALASMPVANAHSRSLEFAADAYAVEARGSADALVSAFEKHAEQNLANKEPARWVEVLLHGHPSMARRIARARER